MGTKFNVNDVIKHCAYETSINGYVKRSDDPRIDCTADKVIDAIVLHEVTEEQLQSVRDRVARWLEYVNNQTGEYFDNVRSEISKPKVEEGKIGLIASSFSTFDKYNKSLVLNEIDKQSNYLGEEGDSVTFTIKDSTLLKNGTSKFKNGNSKWYLFKFHDTDNNVITLFANDDLSKSFKEGVKLSGIVNKLSEYNGIKQTQISKLRFVDGT